MKLTNEEYREYAEKHSPRSDTKGNMLRAFVSGGAICVIGQALRLLYSNLGAQEETASAAVSITLVFVGALLTGLAFMTILPNSPGQVHLYRLPDLQTLWLHRHSNSRQKALSPVPPQRCL